MSAPPKRKKTVPLSSLPTGKGKGDRDNRKHRRNRVPQSCLPCHTSKRKCDRKRPCGRCTQLGNTGLCVYEIVDPSPWIVEVDDMMYHQRRMAELQGVIREFVDKPHPRLFPSQLPPKISKGQQGHISNAPIRSASLAEHSSSSRTPHREENVDSLSPLLEADGTPAALHSILVPESLPSQECLLTPCSLEELLGRPSSFRNDLFNMRLTSSSTSSMLVPSNISSNTSLPIFLTSLVEETTALRPSDLTSVGPQSDPSLAGLLDSTSRSFEHQTRLEECRCLSDAENRRVVLELYPGLRRAADTLNRYPLHDERSTCRIKQHMTDMSALIGATPGIVDTPGMSGFGQTQAAQPSDVGFNPYVPYEAGLAGGSVAFSMLAIHPETSVPVMPSFDPQISWTPQELWDAYPSSTPQTFSWASTRPHYPNLDTINSSPLTN